MRGIFKQGLSHAVVSLFSALLYFKALADKVLDFKFDESDQDLYFPSEIAEYIHQLWKDPIIPKILDEHASDFYLMDSAA